MALVRNLVDGCLQSIDYVFAENGIILDAMGRQLQYASEAEIGIQVRTTFLHNSSHCRIEMIQKCKKNVIIKLLAEPTTQRHRGRIVKANDPNSRQVDLDFVLDLRSNGMRREQDIKLNQDNQLDDLMIKWIY